MQAAATMSLMAEMERALRDLSLALPFYLIEVQYVLYIPTPYRSRAVPLYLYSS